MMGTGIVAAEAAALIVTLKALESALTSPDASTARLVKAFVPLAKVPVANDQLPLALVIAVPISVAPSNTTTLLLANAVPVSVMLSPATPPFDEYPLIVGVASVGVAPATSMTRGWSASVTWTDCVFRYAAIGAVPVSGSKTRTTFCVWPNCTVLVAVGATISLAVFGFQICASDHRTKSKLPLLFSSSS